MCCSQAILVWTFCSSCGNQWLPWITGEKPHLVHFWMSKCSFGFFLSNPGPFIVLLGGIKNFSSNPLKCLFRGIYCCMVHSCENNSFSTPPKSSSGDVVWQSLVLFFHQRCQLGVLIFWTGFAGLEPTFLADVSKQFWDLFRCLLCLKQTERGLICERITVRFIEWSSLRAVSVDHHAYPFLWLPLLFSVTSWVERVITYPCYGHVVRQIGGSNHGRDTIVTSKRSFSSNQATGNVFSSIEYAIIVNSKFV